jgi:hypothetical protein
MRQAEQEATLKAIRIYIGALRERRGIKSYRREPLPEPSGIAFGEIASLVELRLLYEFPGTGAWNELTDDPGLCTAVHGYLEREAREQPHAA